MGVCLLIGTGACSAGIGVARCGCGRGGAAGGLRLRPGTSPLALPGGPRAVLAEGGGRLGGGVVDGYLAHVHPGGLEDGLDNVLDRGVHVGGFRKGISVERECEIAVALRGSKGVCADDPAWGGLGGARVRRRSMDAADLCFRLGSRSSGRGGVGA